MAQETTDPLKMGRWYRLMRVGIGLAIRALARLEIRGTEHIPDRGPYLVVTNHLHWLDPPVLGVILPHQISVFAAEKWEHHWFFGPFFRSVGAIFVQRGEVDRKALRQALAVLQRGGVLGLAPEGTRSRTGVLQKGRHGASYLAYRAGAPLLPVAVYGQEKVFGSLRSLRRATIHVVFGPLIELPPVEGKASTAEVHALTEEIMYRLAAMLPPEYRGVYSDVTEKRPDLLAQD